MANAPEPVTSAHEHEHVGHVVPMRYLLLNGVALLILTVLTVAVTGIDLGREANIFIALAIAVVKATLVAMFFMHLFWDRPFNAIVFVGSVVFVAGFIAFSLVDSFSYRGFQSQYEQVELQGGDALKVQQQLEAAEAARAELAEQGGHGDASPEH